jgi:hypothetical protein
MVLLSADDARMLARDAGKSQRVGAEMTRSGYSHIDGETERKRTRERCMHVDGEGMQLVLRFGGRNGPMEYTLGLNWPRSWFTSRYTQ